MPVKQNAAERLLARSGNIHSIGNSHGLFVYHTEILHGKALRDSCGRTVAIYCFMIARIEHRG